MIRNRIKRLLYEMEKESIDYYIIPTADYHNSEYVCDFFKCREYMSGFSGSAGTLVVSVKEAGLWTDGRYFIQAEEQLKGTGIHLYKSGNKDVPEIKEYLKRECEKKGLDSIKSTGIPASVNIGFDGRVMEISFVKELEKELTGIAGVSINVNPFLDLAGRLWEDRPNLTANEIYQLADVYTGKSASEKINELRLMIKDKAEYHLIASLDDIAWLLNLRGSDVACNPVFLSYFFISEEDAVLFCHKDRLKDKTSEYLADLGIRIMGYEDVYSFLKNFGDGTEKERKGKILLDPDTVNYRLYTAACERFEPVLEKNPSSAEKGKKNPIEADNIRAANIVDGIAMVKFLKWLDDYKHGIVNECLTETGVVKKLLEFRKMNETFIDISFDTIAAYGAHGAIVHYEPTPVSDIPLERKGFLLVDSGAQYYKGTTDITRTISLGELSEEMKKHYTAVLRGNLRLAAAVFPAGISGANLDILARGPIWDLEKDYNHGTGHGIGCFLNVHEGPQNINWKIAAKKGTSVPLACGMVTSDEPGFYKEGEYGIRIENDILTVKKTENEYGTFLGFEVLTLAPIDLTPVIWEDMTKDEIETLNEYHKTVYEKLSPYLDNATAEWLKRNTVDFIKAL